MRGLAGHRVHTDHVPETWKPKTLHALWQEKNQYEDTAGESNQKAELKIKLTLREKQDFLF